MRPCWAVLMLSVSVHGQTLRVSPVMAHRSQTIELEVSIESPAGKEPLSLQFEANYPVRQMEADRGGPVVGEPAKSAGKFITCATRWKKAPVVSSLKCIVAGGQKPIPNGKLAALRFKIPVTADYGAYKVTVEEAQSVGADMKLVKLKKAEGTVTIGRAQ